MYNVRLLPHITRPFSTSVFTPNELVIVTEWVAGEIIHIAKDRLGNISVSTPTSLSVGCSLKHFKKRTLRKKLWDTLRGAGPELVPFWKAAYNSGIVGYLRNWPPIGDIQVVGVVVPTNKEYHYAQEELVIKIVRVVLDGRDQPYHSFFPNWVPLLMLGRYSEERLRALVSGPEEISGKHVHKRKGVVVRPFKVRYEPSGEPVNVCLEGKS